MEIALHTEQLEYLLTHLVHTPRRVHALGVFPADLAPVAALCDANGVDRCMIVNTDPAARPGQHWLAFYYDAKRRQLEYFDPFGMPLRYYVDVFRSFQSCSGRSTPVEVVKGSPLQSFDSTVCGFYCLVYLHYRAQTNKPMIKLRPHMLTQTRDDWVVDKLHKLTHSHKCRACPTASQCTMLSQRCVTRHDMRK